MRSIGSAMSLRFFFVLLLVSVTAGTALADAPLFARLETGEGPILLVFYPELAPNHVENFTHLARTGFYNGTQFHRVIEGFMIQGGDPNSKDMDPRNDGMGGPTMKDVLTAEQWKEVEAVNEMISKRGYLGLDGPANLKAEFSPNAKHVRGTLSMARSRSVDSAGSQFFICVATASSLDNQYTIFGHVVLGMDAADKIVSAEKRPKSDAPAVPVAIENAVVFEGLDGLTADEKAAWKALPKNLKSQKK